jgi:hypothetical protein
MNDLEQFDKAEKLNEKGLLQALKILTFYVILKLVNWLCSLSLRLGVVVNVK